MLELATLSSSGLGRREDWVRGGEGSEGSEGGGRGGGREGEWWLGLEYNFDLVVKLFMAFAVSEACKRLLAM